MNFVKPHRFTHRINIDVRIELQLGLNQIIINVPRVKLLFDGYPCVNVVRTEYGLAQFLQVGDGDAWDL